MGKLTLGEFKSELRAIIGPRAPEAEARVGLWINLAYQDITGAISFDELEREINEAASGGIVTLPDDARAVVSVGVSGVPGILSPMGKVEYYRTRHQEGAPRRWTKIRNQIRVAPVPPGSLSLMALIKIDPPLLNGDSDKTMLPGTWDSAIHYLSVSHAFYALGEDSRGVGWFNRANAYIQTRAAEEGRTVLAPVPDPMRLHGSV